MFWRKRKTVNRRLGRVHVLDVKLRSSKVRAARARRAIIGLGICFGTVFGLYALWCLGEFALDKLVYENRSFAIQKIEVQTDGVISSDQLRRWSGVRAGENLLALDLARVKRNLEMVPMIDSVSIERILPGTLRLRVSEREPIAQVNVPVPRADGGLDVKVFQLDESGYVMLPLDPRQRAAPPTQADGELPLILGINAADLQPGRKLDSTQLQAALKWIEVFESSPMANVVELKKVDVLSPEVLVVTTGQGSQVTFGLQNFDQQLLRWQRVQEECAKLNKTITTLNLAVMDNTPLRLSDASALPPSAPKPLKIQHKRRNV
ncbi:MAG TPA: FtsQ-type POTRA domain-containing protein [Verrucomicrobiae bacterium]|nr:FtsQ-type POTRA domain-containing protein [Verrucomicrobiae bacterium]